VWHVLFTTQRILTTWTRARTKPRHSVRSVRRRAWGKSLAGESMLAGILQVKKQELFPQLHWNSGLIQRRKIAVLPFRLFPQLQWKRVFFLRLCWNFLRPKSPR
jgi:hypothetical protein